MKEPIPQQWLSERARTADSFHVTGLCYAVAAALDVCQRENEIIEAKAEMTPNLYWEVHNALEFLANYGNWQEMGNVLTRVQRMYLLTFVYVGQDPQDHHDEFLYEWTRP